MTLAVKKNVIHPISLGILCFQGLGLRIFEGVFNGGIVVWAIVLFLLNFKYVAKQPNSYWIKEYYSYYFYPLVAWHNLEPGCKSPSYWSTAMECDGTHTIVWEMRDS